MGDSAADNAHGQLISMSILSENWSAEKVLEWALSTYKRDIAIASAFGAEGMVLIDMAAHLYPDIRIFTLDTNFLFPETYRLAAQVQERYGVSIEWVHPDLTVAEQEAAFGPELWRRDPDLCCQIRKIDPLTRKIRELDAWITAIRRDQTDARAGAKKVEWDRRFGLLKVNPLVDWTRDQVWKYIREREIPYNPLHDKNYPSIGCIHCTRAVGVNEDPRAGRWSGRGKRECGLHEWVNI